MKLKAGDVAVVTGAAQGIGLSMAAQLADMGLKVILVDINQDRLDVAVEGIRAKGGEAAGFVADVTKKDNIRNVLKFAKNQFGFVQLLINNAGIFCQPGFLWEQAEDAWGKALAINLGGVLNGLEVFIPHFLEQSRQTHVVNISSTAGLYPVPGGMAYTSSKFAVTAITESLELELGYIDNQIEVSLACPGFTQTGIVEALDVGDGDTDPALSSAAASMKEGVTAGFAAEDVAARILEGVQKDEFYIMTHPHTMPYIKARFDRILTGQSPSLPGDLADRFSK